MAAGARLIDQQTCGPTLSSVNTRAAMLSLLYFSIVDLKMLKPDLLELQVLVKYNYWQLVLNPPPPRPKNMLP